MNAPYIKDYDVKSTVASLQLKGISADTKEETIEKQLEDLLELISRDNIRKTCDNKRETCDHKYEQQLALIANSKISGLEETLKKILEKYILSNDLKEQQISFNAYYTLHIYYRHTLNKSQLLDLEFNYCNKYEENHPITAHLILLTKLTYGVTEELLDLASANVEKFLYHAGVHHALSHIVVEFCEQKLEQETDLLHPSKEYEDLSKKWLIKGKEAVEEAIKLESEYAKFHVMKGRILSLQNNFAEAKKEIAQAIQLEPTDSANYAIRISQYSTYDFKNRMREQLFYSFHIVEDKLEENKKEYQKTLNKVLHKNLEYMALFCAMIAIFIAVLQFQGQLNDAKQVCGVISFLFGCISCTFVIFNFFSYIGNNNEMTIRLALIYIAVFLIGLVSVIVSFHCIL